jgi:hypothetical protein
VIRDDVIEAIAMNHEVATVGSLVDVLVSDAQVIQNDRNKPVENVVMIASEVNRFGFLFGHLPKHGPDKLCVLSGPLPSALEFPSVDDVAIEEQLFTKAMPEKMAGLNRLTLGHSEVNVGDDDGLEAELLFGGVGWCDHDEMAI